MSCGSCQRGQLRRRGRSQSRSWRGRRKACRWDEDACRMAEEALSEGCKKGCQRAAVSGSTDEPPAAPRPGCACTGAANCVIRKHGARPPLARLAAVLVATEPSAPSEGEWAAMSSRDCQRRVRMRLPPPTSAMMRARTMLDAMIGTELPAAASGLQSRSAEALSRAYEAPSRVFRIANRANQEAPKSGDSRRISRRSINP